jgi:hypothetical protein
MSFLWHDNCNTINNFIIDYDNNTELVSDGVSIYPNPVTLDPSGDIYYASLGIIKYVNACGDFEFDFDVSIPIQATPVNDYNNGYFDIYINLFGNTGGRSYIDFYYEQNNNGINPPTATMYVYGWMDSANAIPITLPYNGVWKAKRIDNMVSFWMDDIKIYEVENVNGFTTENINIQWSGYTDEEAYEYRGLKINDINIAWDGISSEAHLGEVLYNFHNDPSAYLDFYYSTYIYNKTVKNSVDAIDLTLFTISTEATPLKLNGNIINQGELQTVNLDLGLNIITAEVFAQDDITSLVYTFNITRNETMGIDATLNSLYSGTSGAIQTPTFNPSTLNYDIVIPYNRTYTYIYATPTEAFSTIKFDGTIASYKYLSLPSADSIVNVSIEVTAEDGITKKTYTVSVSRGLPSDICTLSALSSVVAYEDNSNGSSITITPSFNSSVLNYSNSNFIYKLYTKIAINFSKTNSYSTVKINDITYSSGTGYISAIIGVNTFTIEVTAQNGSSKTIYILIVTISGEAQFDFQRDYNNDQVGSNPNGQWSYGWKEGDDFGGELNLFNSFNPDNRNWSESGRYDGGVWTNLTGYTVYDVPNGITSLHPLSGDTSIENRDNYDCTVVRWKSLESCSLRVVGYFAAGAIYKNNVEVLSQPAYYGDWRFDFNINVVANDFIDFIVGDGYWSGNTPLYTYMYVTNTAVECSDAPLLLTFGDLASVG